MSADSTAHATQVDLDRLTLVYRDPQGTEYTQPLADITDAGTLIDPETGDDLELDHALISEQPDGWCNSVPRELAGVLEDREDAASISAARWLQEHENDDAVWFLIGRLLDRLTEMADQSPSD